MTDSTIAVISGLAALAILGYLLYTLMRPERF
jgi:K+-transporting ATPase KdpF subunit